MKRKALYMIAACVTLLSVIVITHRPSPERPVRTFKFVYEDGVGGPGGSGHGPGGRGNGAYMKAWESSDGVRVSELMGSYTSAGEARKAYEEWLGEAEKII